MNTFAEWTDALNDAQREEGLRIREERLQNDACSAWNALTEAEERGEVWGKLTNQQKREQHPELANTQEDENAELRAELADARQQHEEDAARIQSLEDQIFELRNMLADMN